MQFELNQAQQVLSRTPKVLDQMLRGLSPGWIETNYGDATFSPFDVIGHLLHGERNDWMARVELILDAGEAQPFKSWDRYAMYEESHGKSIDQLLDEFASARKENLVALASRNLDDSELDKTGTHPRFGSVTLRQLLSTWVVHDLNHTHQIAKCMAWQYREEIGPWREYVTFMDR